jgi:glutamyl-Q tRNA(Asp) synthetase
LGGSEPIYPGTCRNGPLSGRPLRSIRVRVADEVVAFEDRLQGRIEQNLAKEVGDFVVRRADDIYAYQLAVVVDDFEQGVTDVVRGADLLASTPRQILLQRLLGYPTPRYAHLPVAVNQSGEKLSKQTRAAPLGKTEAPVQLWRALRFLGQEPLEALKAETVADIWDWAFVNWRTERIPLRRSIRENDYEARY